MLKCYILNDDHTISQVSMVKAAVWEVKKLNEGNTDSRRVKLTKVGSYTVSTVLLHYTVTSEGEESLPFETLITSSDPDEEDEVMRRYLTWDDAVAGHDEMVAKIESHIAQEARNARSQSQEG